MEMFCQAELKALPVNTSSRTSALPLMLMIQPLTLNGRLQHPNSDKYRAGGDDDFVLTEKVKYLMSGDCLRCNAAVRLSV